MKRSIRIFSLFILVAILFSCARSANNAFPNRPVKIVVYTAPGGLIDITARKFTDVATKYTDATFVVENRPGAGGAVGIQSVLQAPADGYTIFAGTKSNISFLVGADAAVDPHDLNWFAMLMADPECVITNVKAEIDTWEEIVEDAKERPGEQIWLGPDTGGLDHIMAMKLWERSGIACKWIPFKSGGAAKTALLGGQGVCYVGNPRDIGGNPDLKVAAVSAEKRLPQFPDTPTFTELGLPRLEHEIMWRGFAVKKGTPKKALAWFSDLIDKVTQDPDWRAFWEKGGIEVVHYGPEEFNRIVERDRMEFHHYLASLGLIEPEIHPMDGSEPRPNQLNMELLTLGILMVQILLFAIAGIRLKSKLFQYTGRILFPIFFISLSLFFWMLSTRFRSGESYGPAIVPRLWSIFLTLFSFILYVKVIMGKEDRDPKPGRLDTVIQFIVLLMLYLPGINYIGYFISTIIFLPVAMWLLGYRRKIAIILITIVWTILSWALFFQLLHVALPTGILLRAMG